MKTQAADILCRQCLLRNGIRLRTSWIPDEFAVLGQYLRLQDADKQWENGWQVLEVGSEAIEYKKLHERWRNWRRETHGSEG